MKRKILVADDDRGMVRTLCDILRARGWEPVGVHSGEEAVEMACSDGFGVILMDIVMPGMDGVTALKALKTSKPAATVILMTAQTADDLIADALKAGAKKVLTKPVDLNLLLQSLEGDSGTTSG